MAVVFFYILGPIFLRQGCRTKFETHGRLATCIRCLPHRRACPRQPWMQLSEVGGWAPRKPGATETNDLDAWRDKELGRRIGSVCNWFAIRLVPGP